MLVLALLLVAVAVVLGFYAQANPGGHDFTIFGSTWHTYAWVPAALAAGAVAVIALGSMAYGMWRIRKLRRANIALRHEINLFKLERATAQAAASGHAEAERELVGRHARRPARAEPVAAVADRAERETVLAGAPARAERSDAEHLQTFPVEAGRSR